MSIFLLSKVAFTVDLYLSCFSSSVKMLVSILNNPFNITNTLHKSGISIMCQDGKLNDKKVFLIYLQIFCKL